MPDRWCVEERAGSLEQEVIRRDLNSTGISSWTSVQMTPSDLIELASCFGPVEMAWEDQHPEHTQLQLLDSRKQQKRIQKGSSQYWHTDRSFVPFPSRLTFLYAEKIYGEVRATEFVSMIELTSRIDAAWLDRYGSSEAVHSFALNFPKIMREKGHAEEKINRQISLYPEIRQPLLRRVNRGRVVYFNELCVREVFGLPGVESENLISDLVSSINSAPRYSKNWREGDLLVWDNYSVIHRGAIGSANGHRRLLRATTSEYCE